MLSKNHLRSSYVHVQKKDIRTCFLVDTVFRRYVSSRVRTFELHRIMCEYYETVKSVMVCYRLRKFFAITNFEVKP
jgi:hypothetical protein